MGRATVIVAIPPVDERVHKISSEAIPHLTLLYLGDVDLSEGAMLYVQHACEELSPFGLSVDYRGELGEDSADVLFFEDNAWDLKRVKEFRHWLLLNDEIKRAYDAAEQHPEWTPHLTLGYPEAPARELDDEDRRIRYVDFDRVAVWTGDFEGPEFRLKYDDHSMEVAMSDMSTTERGAAAVAELFHSGVKGMKWGVRKDEDSSPKQRGKIRRGLTKANVATSAGAKAINEGEKKLIFLPQEKRVQAASATQSRVLGEAARINKDPKFKGKDLKRDPALKAAYFKEVEASALKIYKEELAVARVEHAAEVLSAVMSASRDNVRVTAPSDRIRHDDGDDEILVQLDFEFDELGQISDITVPDKYLKHYGTKGMKWGVRKDEATSRGGADLGPTAVVVEQKKPGTYAKSKGGQGHPLHDDAKTALEARQKAKASTTDALSNVELRKAVERMQLEKQYAQLQFESDRRSRGLRFISGFFGKPRYTDEKRRYRDSHEQSGEHIRKAADTISTLLKEPA